MKNLKYVYPSLLLICLVSLLAACKKEVKDIAKVKEEMDLTVSSAEIILDENNPGKDIVTFSWAPARPQSDDHLVSYTTKLDLVGNNFGSSTAIMSYEDDGVFSKSFSSEQLQNWANEKWGVPVNKPFAVEFRTVAQWEGGATFEAPEVRTIRVTVQPIKTVVFEADKIFLDGTAVPGLSAVELSKTLENLNQYALVLNLDTGELQLPVAFNGAKNYIGSSDASTVLKDGEAVGIKMRETPFSWKITTAGQYRVVVNMQKATATIYSPAKALLPKTVSWNGTVPMEVTISELWMHGAINNWGTPVKMDCKVSQADPQVLVYNGGRIGKTKFIVYGGSDTNKDLSYAFSCPLSAAGTFQELTLALGKIASLSGGASRPQRDSYYTIPAGTNMLILDLRNMTILAEKR